jgi:integrase
LKGRYTNHSLRATTATRLYQAGVEEQLIMERTGHRSLDGKFSKMTLFAVSISI